MDFRELTEEQQAKARECNTAAELLALAQNEGIELTDEQLEAVSGGSEWYEPASDYQDDWRPIPGC